jgi:hypothetical protein
MRTAVSALVALLALAVGALHFALDFVLFRGNFSGLPQPPPGPPPGFIATLIGPRLPQLFLANFIVFVVLVIAFVAASRARTAVRAAVDVLILLATVATLVGWNGIRRPNPMGLGSWAVALEIALIVFALVHLATLRSKSA